MDIKIKRESQWRYASEHRWCLKPRWHDSNKEAWRDRKSAVCTMTIPSLSEEEPAKDIQEWSGKWKKNRELCPGVGGKLDVTRLCFAKPWKGR